ncbi:uncharacterized protein PAE49_021173 isoform 2-T2 [Odontesthes bonariensis]
MPSESVSAPDIHFPITGAPLHKPVRQDNPLPVLNVSPSWLSPGASVTLRCKVHPQSAGWRFYWYKAVPDLSRNSYNYELLPETTNGTAEDFYVIHGQTHTAGYVCRAGGGDPEHYTYYSKLEFVWSGDVHPAASLTVSPDRVQHFTSESVSLKCDGNSTEWRVMRSTGTRYLSYLPSCSNWRTTNASACTIIIDGYHNGVYWCESGSGDFSNAINITAQHKDIILVSHAHPVTEGASVTLSCRQRGQTPLSNVSFYHNDKLLQNDHKGELNISAVSKSDEGFYKCEHAGKVSPPSWMSVRVVKTDVSRPESSLFPVLLMVGKVGGIIFIIFLFLPYRCRQSAGSTGDERVGQYENEQQVYSSLLHGDLCVYETIRGPENSGNDRGGSDYANV